MTDRFHLACQCGVVRGEASVTDRRDWARLLCHCASCRRWAELTGPRERLLDGAGGVDLVQAPPASLRWTQGADQIACAKMTESGPWRWHASCCGSGLAISASDPRIPHLTLPLGATDLADVDRDRLFGAPDAIFTETATAPVAARPAYKRIPFRLVARLVLRMLRVRARGAHKPNPMFDAVTGAPLARPRPLTDRPAG